MWPDIAPTPCFDISTTIWDGSTTHLLDPWISPQNRAGPPADQQIHTLLWIHLHISHSVLWIHLHKLYCIYCIVYYICTYCIVYIVLCIWREDDEGDEGRFAVGQLTPVPLDQWSHCPKDPSCNASEPGNGVDTEKEGEREPRYVHTNICRKKRKQGVDELTTRALATAAY